MKLLGSPAYLNVTLSSKKGKTILKGETAMPEGPEIRRAADSVESALKSKIVEDIYFAFPHLEDYGDLLKGSLVKRVD
jgi:hypothetical protein